MKQLRTQRVGKAVYDAEVNKWFVQKLDSQAARQFNQIFPNAENYGKHGLGITASVPNSAFLQWFTLLYPLTLSGSDRKHLVELADRFRAAEKKQKDLAAPGNRKNDSSDGLQEGWLYKWYQREALDFIDFQQNGIVLYDVGVGKTLIGLGIASLSLSGPLVLVVEPNLSGQMVRDCKEATIFKCHEVEGTTPYDLPEDCDIYIMKYTQLDGWQDYLSQGWVGAIAFDEVQNLRGGKSTARGAAADHICDHVPVVVGLTATLIFNKGLEAYTLSEIFNNPIFGTKADFIEEWCGGNNDGYVLEPKKLGEYMQRKGFIHRRTKAECGIAARQTAPKIEFVKSDGSECPELLDRAKELARETLVSDKAGVDSAQAKFRGTMYQLTGIAKARGVAKQVRQFLDAETPIVLFGHHQEVFNIWMNELAEYKPALINGRVPAKQREIEKQRFISGETNIVLLGVGMGAGMNGLEERCSTAVLGELSWVPGEITQCIGRLDRGEPTCPVYVYYYVSVYGSDLRMLDVLKRKEGQRDGVETSNCVKPMGVTLQETREMAKDLLDGNITDPKAMEFDIDDKGSLPMSTEGVQLELLGDELLVYPGAFEASEEETRTAVAR